MNCIIKDCGNKQSFKNKLISFHRFPTADVRKIKWLNSLNLTSENIADFSVVCSNHFYEKDFINFSFGNRRRLYPSSIPHLEKSSEVINCNAFSSKKGTEKQILPHKDIAPIATANALLRKNILKRALKSSVRDADSANKADKVEPNKDTAFVSSTHENKVELNEDTASMPSTHEMEVEPNKDTSFTSSIHEFEVDLKEDTASMSFAEERKVEPNKDTASSSEEEHEMEMAPNDAAHNLNNKPPSGTLSHKTTLKNALKSSDVSAPRSQIELEQDLMLLQKVVEKRNLKIKTLYQKLRRQSKKIAKLSQIVAAVKKEKQENSINNKTKRVMKAISRATL